MAQTAKLRTPRRLPASKQPAPPPERVAPRVRPRPNAPARRKRQLGQRMRRFEAVFTGLPASFKNWQGRWAGPQLSRFGFTGWRTSKVFSLLLLLAAIGLVGWVQTDEQWFVYRDNVQIHGPAYLDANALYQASGIDAWNIFWLQPALIRQRLKALPYVADAEVQTRLPNHVDLTIKEVQPVALWVTEQATLWLLPNGVALPAQGKPQTKLLEIIDGEQAAKALDTHQSLAIDANIMQSALALKQQLPEIQQLRFNKDYGLNFRLPSSDAWVYWGDGDNREAKFANLAAIQSLIKAGKTQPQIIDVRYERPYVH
ncbi:MAG: FtsQ-type POTRA domain-containing protein [Caldilineaceae bacterium]